MLTRSSIRCDCGLTVLTLKGQPIVTVECHCDSCREAAHRLESLAAAPKVAEPNGGTWAVLYRKDRVDCVSGAETLAAHRLDPMSKTRRVVATCCNSAMFLDFTPGHWLTLYARRWQERDRPRLEMRVMVGDRPAELAPLPDDVRNLPGHSLPFMARLVRAWIGMGFRRPKLDWIRGSIDEKAR